MELGLNNTQKLSQRTLTAIGLLKYNNVEIAGYINEVLESNPLIESLENEEDAPPVKARDKFEWLAVNDEQNKDFYRSDYERDERGDIFEIAEVKQKTLANDLYEQLYSLKLPQAQAELCEYIIESLNDSGYFDGDISEVAARFRCSKKEVRAALKVLQGFEPDGVCAANLTDCLIIQLEKQGCKNELAFSIVKNDMSSLGKRKVKSLALKYGVSANEVSEAMNIIYALNPRPSAGYAAHDTDRYIVPDVNIMLTNGAFEIQINDSYVPRLRVSPAYVKLLSSDSGETQKYVSKKLDQAVWTIKCIEMRREAIYKTAKAVAERQRDFFIKGLGYLKPLTMREIAADLNVHESTVSRTVKNKYVGCAYGCFPFSYFFDNKASGDSETASSQNVKRKLKELIESEDKTAPYSDMRLTELINKDYVSVKRRTIAKYRAALGYLPAAERRRL